MNELELFNFEGSEVRTLTIDGNPYFVGKDIAEILGYKNTKDALSKHVDSEEKRGSRIATPSGTQTMTVINESGLYSLILSSKLPDAKKFKRWVTSEVLPAIRKHGGYLTDEKMKEALLNPDTIITLATQLKREKEARLMAEQRANELSTKADYCDVILANKSLVTITQIAKDYGMSGKAMNQLLHEKGVIYKQGSVWLLYAKYQGTGWTQSETKMITTRDGMEKAVLNTKWTQKGRLGLYELLKRDGILPLIERG